MHLLTVSGLQSTPSFSYHVLGDEPGSWPAILSSIGLVAGSPGAAGVVVAPRGVQLPFDEWAGRVDRGTILIIEGDSALASSFGFTAASKPKGKVQSVEDTRDPQVRIIWEKPLDLAQFEVPKNARIFVRERWQKVPLMAGYRRGEGAVLWLAASPGPNGYERFPYILQALVDLGLETPFHSRRLWAFFDSSYRLRADLDYLAARWRAAGISALQVAAWHHWERDPQRDAYLRKLIDACHRHAILVYAWLELPHVSEQFWDRHPEWREKTALRQDAQLDWRKLMNLANPDASIAIDAGVKALLKEFDWDGVNLAELYFESLEGHGNPARFTPLNQEVRKEFQHLAGFDPLVLFDALSPNYWQKNAEGLSHFLQYRAELARRLQAQWIARVEEIRREKTHLDLVLTHIDDQFDRSMREKLGADTSRVLPLLADHDFTFLIEDPATIWNLGPRRYTEIAARYAPLTPAQERLAIDVNIVERYQDVYPTKQQTGVELFQLVHTASAAFPRVALYFENSILRTDWGLLASSGALVDRVERDDTKMVIHSRRGVEVQWRGPALVDGKLWPITNDSVLWLPEGVHVIQSTAQRPPVHILDFNGDLKSAKATANGAEFAYQSSARAMAILDAVPERLEIDNVPAEPQMIGRVLVLPRGQHIVSIAGSYSARR